MARRANASNPCGPDSLPGEQLLRRLATDLDVEGNVLMPFLFGILPKRHAQGGRGESLPGQRDHRVQVTADPLRDGELLDAENAGDRVAVAGTTSVPTPWLLVLLPLGALALRSPPRLALDFLPSVGGVVSLGV